MLEIEVIQGNAAYPGLQKTFHDYERKNEAHGASPREIRLLRAVRGEALHEAAYQSCDLIRGLADQISLSHNAHSHS